MPQTFSGKDLYGSFGGTPGVEQSVSLPGYHVQATPDAFGAPVAKAREQTGQQTEDIANKYLEMNTQSRVNDDFANKYAPAAAQLRAQFDSLRGADKIAGYDQYISGLQGLNKQFVSNAPNPIYATTMGSLLDRHVSNEIDGAKRELVTASKEYSDQSTYGIIKAQSGIAAQNYNDPNIVNQVAQSNDAHVALNAMNNGLDLNDPDHAQALENTQRQVKGDMASGMIDAAMSKGDINSAQKIRDSYSSVIPGFKQLDIDNKLHAQSMQQVQTYGVKAFKEGQPLPQTVGSPAFQVQAAVADSAAKAGVEPNDALTVARIESSMGQNVGRRGTVGQTADKHGGDLNAQADDLCAALRKSKVDAQEALGRDPEPWESYLVYQQGSGGGPALLKAAAQNSTAKAIDVLTPLYDNPKDARNAIIKNGGTETMTAGDFAQFIQQKYDANAARAKCTTPEGKESLGQAITDVHTRGGEVVQKGATPIQNLHLFDAKVPDMIQRIQNIPNDEVRQGVMEAFKRDHAQYQAAADAYMNVQVSKAHELAANPDFTDMSQMPADMMATAVERPALMNFMEKSAASNLDKKSGVSSKDIKEYGRGFYDIMRKVNSGEISNNLQLMEHLPKGDGSGGDITLAGYEKLHPMLGGDALSKSDLEMQTQAFKIIKNQLSGGLSELGIKDPKGEELWGTALPRLFEAIKKGQSEGKTMGQLTDPQSPDFIGKSVQSLKRSASQQVIDYLHHDEAPKRTAYQLIQEYNSTTDESKRKALRQEAVDLGYIPPETNRVEAPISE